MKYRKEIDGLRALAVVPVILFHAGFELFSGGFVGVDVFFVISGYLITTILIEDIEKDRFSIVNFYERRARRILPALFFVMAACVLAAWVLLLPSQMKDLTKSVVAVSLFVSNVLFWQQDGYFAATAEEKPLLHTWSLAVEEQYYLLFPVFLFLAWRFGKSRVFWMIVLLALGSLVLCEWGWRHHEAANFYLSPTRAWELFAGSIVAFVVQKHGVRANNTVSLLGLSAILFAIFAYDKSTPFPSLYALVPVIGVMLLVLYADNTTLVAKILGNKLFVGIGLISYSAYLWHQPLFAFTRIHMLDKPSSALMLTLSLISILFGYLSWKYVEKPFRGQDALLGSQTKIFTASLSGLLVFGILGFMGTVNGGFMQRFSDTDLALINYVDSQEVQSNYVTQNFGNLRRKEWVNNGRPKVLVVGDSFAQDLVNAIYAGGLSDKFDLSTRYYPKRCGNLFIPKSQLLKIVKQSDVPNCSRSEAYLDDDWLLTKITETDQIWLAGSWEEWLLPYFKDSLDNLAALTSAKILVFGRKNFPYSLQLKHLSLDNTQRAQLQVDMRSRLGIQRSMEAIVPAYMLVDVQGNVCEAERGFCRPYDTNGMPKTFDGSHLTKYGAKVLGENLKKLLQLSAGSQLSSSGHSAR